eukprot:scaffold349_cov267-Chaetoceros_neogracile.AAC.46
MRQSVLLISFLASIPTALGLSVPPVPKEIDQRSLSRLSKCKSGTSARKVLSDTFSSSPNAALYESVSIPKGASELSISDADLAIQTNIRNAKYSVMELIELNGDKDADRISLALFCLFWGSSLSAIFAQQNMPGPEILRFTLVFLLTFAPLIFVGYGIATPDALQTILISLQRNLFPTYRKRMVHHEAGHFLLGHLLGFPIKDYQANAVKNAVEFYPLRDGDKGRERASLMGFDKRSDAEEEVESYYPEENMGADRPFFSEGGRADALIAQSVFRDAKNYTDNPFLKVAPRDDVSKSWPFRGFDHETLDQLTVVSVAGVCSEILGFGNAEGGFADLAQLRVLFSSADPELSEKDMENRIRFAIGFGMGQLRRNLGALDALVEAMENNASVEECVLAIETCDNVSGATVVGNYEKIRRTKIQREGVGFVERLLLGAGKNADTQDDSVIEGKGGGDKKQTFQLTGDDPFYAALGVAFLFYMYASLGGLSLH